MPKKGFKQSKEVRLKHSLSLRKGGFFRCLICNNEFWRKPIEIRKGHTKFCSKEHYFEWQKGKPKDLSNRVKKIGPENPNWKGGITPISILIRNGPEIKRWRQEVFKRDNWTCQECGARSKKDQYIRIEAHHIKPFARFPELRFVVDNGITLCKKCHSKEPKGVDVWRISY